jgi:6-pyruvoyl-tetrahydropterin synthase
MLELPERTHRAPLNDVQRAIVKLVCDALDHSASTSLLSDVSVTVSTSLERICDIAREQLAPAISNVTRLLSSTSADLTHAFKGLSRLLSVNINEKASIQDPASILLELLPLCSTHELMVAALNVLHAIQV